MVRVGILGGSFNPIHSGHLRMAVEVLERLEMDRVDIVPAGVPPHKPARGMLPFELRYQLAQKAVQGIAGLRVDPMEGRRDGPSYTSDTVAAYAEMNPDDEHYFILGTGTFMELPSWHRGLELPERVSMVVVNRGRVKLEDVEEYIAGHWPGAVWEEQALGEAVWAFPSETRLHYLEIPRLDIKASDIRKRWRAGRNLALLVPASVEEALRAGGAEYDVAWR